VGATRLIAETDAPALAELLSGDRDFMAPYEPDRTPEYWTSDGQLTVVRAALAKHADGSNLPHVILDGDRVVGRITLNEIIRGPLQSCSLGYWVASADNGRGLATAAVREIIGVAFTELGLHRIQAGTLGENVRSQRVLERTGFTRYGLAPAYLHIAGRWQDHLLYQLLSPSDGPPGTPASRV
jgi:[ribosomal protein S5]-alanine N-acetyltransferase